MLLMAFLNMNRVALFDFCETLANFQTADKYVHYTRERYHTPLMRIRFAVYLMMKRFRIVSFLSTKFPRSSINKRLILLQLRGLSKSLLDKSAREYYKDVVKPNLITSIVEEMLSLQTAGYEIVLVSGGYDIYLKYFAEEYGIDKVISSHIRFVGNICLGTIEGKDCLSEEKVSRLEESFPNRSEYYFVAYSDSASDIPLLNWADEAVVVRHSQNLAWPHGFREIIW